MRKRNNFSFFKKLTFFFILSLIFALWQWPDSRLHLVFCDVGQGDAILITKGTTQVLVDGGPNDKVLSCLSSHMPFWDRRLEMVILTHPEKDHGGGLSSVLERYKVKYFASGVLGSDALFYQKLLAIVSKKDIYLLNAWRGDELAVSGIKFFFLWPDKNWVNEKLSVSGEKTDQRPLSKRGKIYQKQTGAVLGVEDESLAKNNFSLVFNLSYGDFKALLTGDADAHIQEEIIERNKGYLKPVAVLKVAHHGSRYAFLDGFLKLVKPEMAVISVGKNPWGHPTKETLDQLNRLGVFVRRTDKEGTIEIISDGRKWWF